MFTLLPLLFLELTSKKKKKKKKRLSVCGHVLITSCCVILKHEVGPFVLCSRFATSWRRIWLSAWRVCYDGISDCPRDQKWFLGKSSCTCPVFGPTRKDFLHPLIKACQEIHQENGVSRWAHSVPWPGCLLFLSKVYSSGQQWPCMYDWCVCCGSLTLFMK